MHTYTHTHTHTHIHIHTHTHTPQSKRKAIALWVVEVSHKVSSMCPMSPQKVLRLLTGEVVKHVPGESGRGGGQHLILHTL